MEYRRFLHPLFLCLGLGLGNHANAIERTETVECDLSDGSAFILQATHDWTMPGDFSGRRSYRDDQQAFEIFYRARGATRWVHTGASLAYQDLGQRPGMEILCSRLGMHQGQPGTGRSLRLPGETRFWVPARTGKSELDETEQKRIDVLLLQRGLQTMGDHRALALRLGKLVQELPLHAKADPACSTAGAPQCTVRAVLRLASTDRGDTWQAASIETAPYFFKTGKALAQQDGLARPSARSLRNYRNRDENDAETSAQP